MFSFSIPVFCFFFLIFYSHPNRRASVRVSTSQPQLGYSTNGNSGGASNAGGSISGGLSSLRSSIRNRAVTLSGIDNGSNHHNQQQQQQQIHPLLHHQHQHQHHHHHHQHQQQHQHLQQNTCEQGTQTPDSISRETRRHKLKTFKFSFNNVTTPALNLR